MEEKREECEALKKKNAELEELVLTDPLTGTGNRKMFDRTHARMIARAKRNEEPFSGAFLDIDHFKKVNDTHGHTAGDTVLTQVAEMIQKNLRGEVDSLCRIGGEEFFILMENTDEAGACKVAERVREAVECTPVILEDGKVINVTVSIGVAECNIGTNNSVREDADAAVYHAKETGRNKVIRYSEIPNAKAA